MHRNDASLGMANRRQRVVRLVDSDGSLRVSDARGDRKREHSWHRPADCVGEYAHLSYAATA